MEEIEKLRNAIAMVATYPVHLVIFNACSGEVARRELRALDEEGVTGWNCEVGFVFTNDETGENEVSP